MHTVKNFGYGHIIEFPNGDEVFVDEDGTSSPILKNEEILDTYVKRFKGNEWEAEKKEAGKYIFNHPETKGRLLLTLEIDFVNRVCTVQFSKAGFLSPCGGWATPGALKSRKNCAAFGASPIMAARVPACCFQVVNHTTTASLSERIPPSSSTSFVDHFTVYAGGSPVGLSAW